MAASEEFPGDPVSYRFDMDRDLICTADQSGRFVSLNGAWDTVLGWSREQLLSIPYLDLVHPDDLEETRAVTARMAATSEQLVNFENRFRARNGGYRWLRWSARSDGGQWFAVAFEVTEEVEARRRLEGMLAEERFLAYAQPITAVSMRPPDRSELLIRLTPEEPGGPPVMPCEFVPQAERLGLIGLVDRWMLERGLEQAVAGHTVQINISQETLRDLDLIEEMIAMVTERRPPTGSLIFELTETTAVENLAAAKDFAERASALGCRFAIDDWGTGYGSLTLLRELDFSYLKIDASFVRGAISNAQDRALVRGVIAFAASLRLRTVAEGVENMATVRLLDGFGVDDVQGYFVGRPQPLTSPPASCGEQRSAQTGAFRARSRSDSIRVPVAN